MKKNLTLFTLALLAVTLFSISGVSAFEQGKQLDLILYHSEYPGCANSVCNITVFYPNNTKLIDSANTTRNIGYSNITLTPAQTQQLGTYTFTVFNSSLFTYPGKFSITPTANEVSTGGAITTGVAILVLFLAGVIFIIVGNVYIPTKNWWFFGVLALAVGFIAIYYDFILIVILLRDIAYATNTYDNFEFILNIAAQIQNILVYAFIAVFLIWVYRKWKQRKQEKENDDGWDRNKFDNFNKE